MLTLCNCLPGSHDERCPFNPLGTKYYPAQPIPIDAPRGWECPRCRIINASWIEACNCSTASYTISWTQPVDYRGTTISITS